MSRTPIINPVLLRQSDFDNPQTTQIYPLGMQVAVTDLATATSQNKLTVWEYVEADGALTAYNWYQIAGTATSVNSVLGAVSYAGRICCPQTAFTSGQFGFVPVKGTCTGNVTAAAGVFTTYLAGYNLKLFTAVTYAMPETYGASTAAVAGQRLPADFAVTAPSDSAATTTPAIQVYLYGNEISVS